MATYQTNEIIAAIPMNISVPHIFVVFDMSNEADLIATFLAVKTRLTVTMLPLLMWGDLFMSRFLQRKQVKHKKRHNLHSISRM